MSSLPYQCKKAPNEKKPIQVEKISITLYNFLFAFWEMKNTLKIFFLYAKVSVVAAVFRLLSHCLYFFLFFYAAGM